MWRHGAGEAVQPLTEEQIMPNWCANRLRVTGLAENVSKVRALMLGEVRPLYARAEGQGIQLFLAGCTSTPTAIWPTMTGRCGTL